MKPIKILLSGIVIALSISITGCNSNPNKIMENLNFVEHILSSSIQDESFIPENLTELNSEDLLKTLTSIGPRVPALEENAKAGKLIKTYFERIGLEPYKNDSYYQPFFAKSNVFFSDPDTGELANSLNGNLENIVGKIKGQDSSKAIVISAHFDSFIGTKGVLDNASGTTALMKIANEISTRLKGKTFPVDIVFAAFNAEEVGLIGSNEFYKNVSKDYKDLYNINIDCVGLKDFGLAYYNTHKESMILYSDLKEYLKKYNVPTGGADINTSGSSDHEPFQKDKKAAVALVEDIPDDLIHTKADDNLDLIDYTEFNNVVKAVSDFVIEGNGKMY